VCTLFAQVREEAGELCETLEKSEGKERAASEMADLLYHAMVLLNLQVWSFSLLTLLYHAMVLLNLQVWSFSILTLLYHAMVLLNLQVWSFSLLMLY
jgi:hypothetical protein